MTRARGVPPRAWSGYPLPVEPAERVPLVWDMETSDPDDFLTLLLLLGHPRVDLRAVTITPGTAEQVGLVRWALGALGREDVPVGAFDITRDKRCVSAWHHDAYGAIAPSRDAEPGPDLLRRALQPGVTLVTGAALKNLGAILRGPDADGFELDRLVVQGGFAGEGVVPPERQLDKFRGRTTCPSFNLNGDPKAVLAAHAHPGIRVRRFVSKNVCHGVVYDAELHAQVAAVRERSPSLALIWQGMDHYLRQSPAGKIFHDPLAACCAIEESIGSWAEVEIYRERGEWGARLAAGTRTFIIVDYDRPRFLATLLAH